ncbi:hypothetical protein RHSIM_Rhsim01G0267200 [Rhododendron simsii]|uniref:Uncharacterized protein n=1 Tax=Rhododendron simsii TaxID=118357 RepID=A0A834LUA1_RHOSS|nr:hypothetical protein RHSIM_Rhsim01G0267200 [Rhododendron simsii]
MRTRNVALAILAVPFLLTIFKPHEAAMDEEESLLLQSLQRGPVNPSAPSPGTYIPASNRAPVTPSGPAPGTYIPASSTPPGQKGFTGTCDMDSNRWWKETSVPRKGLDDSSVTGLGIVLDERCTCSIAVDLSFNRDQKDHGRIRRRPAPLFIQICSSAYVHHLSVDSI